MIDALLLLLFAQSPDMLNDRAQKLAQQGRVEEAVAIWKQLPADYFPAAFNLGFYHYSRKEYAHAAPFLTQAAKLQPADFNSRFLLGHVKSALGDRDGALREWRAALPLQPNHARLMGIMAVEFGQGGYFIEAAAIAKRALALRPNDLDAHLLAIKSCQDSGDPAGAALAEKAAAQFPNSAHAQFERAWYLQRAGQTDASRRLLQRAIDLDPRYEEPHYFLGGIFLDEGRLAEALVPLREAVRLRPDYTSASVALGRALMEMEQFDEAIRVLESASLAAPRHPQPPLMLARLYHRQGDEAKARHARDLSLRLRRENASLMEKPQSRPFRE